MLKGWRWCKSPEPGRLLNQTRFLMQKSEGPPACPYTDDPSNPGVDRRGRGTVPAVDVPALRNQNAHVLSSFRFSL